MICTYYPFLLQQTGVGLLEILTQVVNTKSILSCSLLHERGDFVHVSTVQNLLYTFDLQVLERTSIKGRVPVCMPILKVRHVWLRPFLSIVTYEEVIRFRPMPRCPLTRCIVKGQKQFYFRVSCWTVYYSDGASHNSPYPISNKPYTRNYENCVRI